MKIKFLKEYTVKDASGTIYKEGDIETMADASARHFIDRGVAVVYVATVKKPVGPPNETIGSPGISGK